MKSDYDLNIMQQNQSLEYVVTQVLTKWAAFSIRNNPIWSWCTAIPSPRLRRRYRLFITGFQSAMSKPVCVPTIKPIPFRKNPIVSWPITCVPCILPRRNQAKENLLRENIPKERIFVTGNTVTDALFIAMKEPHQWTDPTLKNLFDPTQRSDATQPAARLILVTAHRRENHGAPLDNVFRGLRRIVDTHPGVYIVYPVHLNPNVQKSAQAVLGNHPRIHLIPPVDYLDLVNLLEKSYLVVTDSGGIQEEAPALGKPVLVLRRVTERPEAVEPARRK